MCASAGARGADDGDVGLAELADLARVDVEVHDLRALGAKRVELAR